MQVGDQFSWMMLTVLEMNVASLSVEVLELVYTTVDTLRMQVLCVQVHVQYFHGTHLHINYLHTTQPQRLPFFSSFLLLGFATVGFTRQSYIVSEGNQLRICVEIIEGELLQESAFILRPSINGSTTSTLE